jgi:hypothetical protein
VVIEDFLDDGLVAIGFLGLRVGALALSH